MVGLLGQLSIHLWTTGMLQWDALFVAAGENKDLPDPTSHRLCEVGWKFQITVFQSSRFNVCDYNVCVCVRSRSTHPYANPEVLSFPVEDGSLAYMRWMDEVIPDDWGVITPPVGRETTLDQRVQTALCWRLSLVRCSDLFTMLWRFWGCGDTANLFWFQTVVWRDHFVLIENKVK